MVQDLGMDSEFDGPEQISQSHEFYTSQPEGCVKLRPSFEKSDVRPTLIPTLLKENAQRYPNNPALAFKNLDGWNFITYSEYFHTVRVVAKAFLKLELERHRTVNILGSNAPEWMIAYMAAITAGGFASGIYQTSSADACLHCLRISGANIVVVEDNAQLEKILQIRNQVPGLKAIIQFSGIPSDPSVLSWNDLLDIGKAESDEKLEKVIQSLVANECCSLLYTSGTTSLPKAVMLSHDNLLFSSKALAAFCGMRHDTIKRILCYLPLSHVAAQVFDMYTIMLFGGCCYFAYNNCMKSQEIIIQHLKEVRPTIFIGVPRIWEKIGDYLHANEANASGLKQRLINYAKSTALAHYGDISKGEINGSTMYKLLSSIGVYSKLKAQVGFEDCPFLFSAGAPFSVELKEYLYSYDLTTRDIYGMSETSGPHTVGTFKNFDSSIIETLPGMRTKIHEPDENGVGEICMNGRHIFMGYLNNLKQTTEVIDEDGWLHSGDLGKLFNESGLQICGRIKELLITSGGENIAPVLIEDAIKNELPVVSQAVVVGDRKKYLSVLITLKSQVDPSNGMPLDELSPPVKDWCRSLNCNYETVSEIICEKPLSIYQALQQGIDRANKKAVSRPHIVRKFTILPRDLSVATGELGPTTKIMRHAVHKKYEAEIEALYDS